MRYEQIEINRLGSQGEVKRRIRCLAGHITVFRANDPQLLKLFANALMGVTIPGERFTVLLDNTPFNSDIHPRIGFGERFRPDDVTTVGKFLINSGAPTDAIDSLLLSHGLGGLTHEACKNLSPQEERMVRLLGVAYSDQGLVVLNDPFSLVPETWHNTFARDLSNFAWQKRAIVVVPELSARPDDWIENEIVSRVQLETPRKRTIGFGGGGDDAETQKLIETLRQQTGGKLPSERASHRPQVGNDLLKGSPASPGEAVPHQPGEPRGLFGQLPPIPKFRLPTRLPSGPFAILGSTFVIAMLATVVVLAIQSPSAIESPQPKQPTETANLTPQIVPTREARSVLDGYPVAISSGVNLALSDPEAAMRAGQIAPTGQIVAPPGASQPNRRPELTQPPSTGRRPQPVTSEESSPAEESAPAEDDAELARRREEIRQRFIEAIQRQAAERQG
jgi:hypothetical protein